jgi:uncharacterized protein (DUF1499 family)
MVRAIIWIVSVVAMLGGLAVLAAGPGTRFGLWDFRVGLGIIQLAAIPLLVAAVAALLTLGLAIWKARRLAPLAAAGLLLAGGAAVVPLQMKAAADANPFIHDITTDFVSPPAIVAASAASRMNPVDYLGGDAVPGAEDGLTVSEAQKRAFPDITAVEVAVDLATVAERAEGVIAAMGMEILNGAPAAPGSVDRLEIEAVATTLWFGFKDDFVVRLTKQPGGVTRVDTRSKSRVGVSDLGANAARTRQFMKELKASMPGTSGDPAS